MAATKQDILEWFEEGVKKNATHMIIVCDTFDWDDYPVFVSVDEDVKEIEKKKRESSMQKVMEVYNLKMPMQLQLDQKRSFNY